MGNSDPLVSCIMPTRNRAAFLPSALKCWRDQIYPERELIILDSSDDPIKFVAERACEELGMEREINARVRYIYSTQPIVIGSARNICCQQSNGDIIAHWDDDDWSGPNRLAEQVDILEECNGGEAVGYATMLFARDADKKAWCYTNANQDPSLPSVVGTSLLYYKAWWKGNRFPAYVMMGELVMPQMFSEDNTFMGQLGRRLIAIMDPCQTMVARIHPANTCQRNEQGNLSDESHWKPAAWSEVEALGYECALGEVSA